MFINLLMFFFFYITDIYSLIQSVFISMTRIRNF